jgi:pantothenate kinase
MDVIDINQLGEEVMQLAENTPTRVIILMYGPPGSGKTTNASQLVNYLNNKHNLTSQIDAEKISTIINEKNITPLKTYKGKSDIQTQICQYDTNSVDMIGLNNSQIPFATHLKMDGFHLPLSVLSDELLSRRGCQESFDASLVVQLFKLLNDSNCSRYSNTNTDTNNWSMLSIPDFDHKIKDPTNPGIFLSSKTKVIVLEGLYLMLQLEPWVQISKLVREIKFNNTNNLGAIVKVIRIHGGDNDSMSCRVARRHLKCGLVESYEEGLKRYFTNDTINADVVNSMSDNTLDDWIINNSKS